MGFFFRGKRNEFVIYQLMINKYKYKTDFLKNTRF